jgi:hypothetical protein
MAYRIRFPALSWHRPASVVLVALLIALTGIAHGLGECAPAQAYEVVASVQAIPPGNVKPDEGADPLGAHMHGEHHQGALSENGFETFERASSAIRFSLPSMRFASRGVAPPQKPPRA